MLDLLGFGKIISVTQNATEWLMQIKTVAPIRNEVYHPDDVILNCIIAEKDKEATKPIISALSQKKRVLLTFSASYECFCTSYYCPFDGTKIHQHVLIHAKLRHILDWWYVDNDTKLN